MRSKAIAILMVLASGFAGAAQSKSGDDTARILALENAWNQAEVKHDVSALSILLGDPFSYTDADGSFLDKAQWLAHIKSEVDQYESLSNSKMEVLMYGNAAIVVGEYRERIKINGKITPRSGRFTDMWMQQNGQWKCIASQSTLIGR